MSMFLIRWGPAKNDSITTSKVPQSMNGSSHNKISLLIYKSKSCFHVSMATQTKPAEDFISSAITMPFKQ